MAAAPPASLQARSGRAQAAPGRPKSSGGCGNRCRWAPSPLLVPSPPPPLVPAARPAAVCCSAGSASQPAGSQPDKQPRQPFSWGGVLRAAVVALLSPVLFPLYVLLVDPPDPEDAPSQPASKPWLPGTLVQSVFHLVALAVLFAGVEALGPFTGPAWAEAAANTLLGNGRVGEVLTACSLLTVPRSPTMQLCTLLAIYCYYRCLYHFEAWHEARYPEQRREPEEGEAPSRRLARQEAERVTRRLFGPRTKAICWVLMLVGGPNKWLYNWLRSALTQYGVFIV